MKYLKNWYSISELAIIGNTKIDYNNSSDSILITYDLPNEALTLNPKMFNWQDKKDCYSAILLMNNLFKKAHKFFQIFGKFPKIEKNNLRIINSDYDVMFLKYGLFFEERYYIKYKSLDNSNIHDLTQNIYLFIFDLFFKEKKDLEAFKKASKKDISLFLWYILTRFNSKEISIDRLNFLSQKIIEIGYNNNLEICNFYFSERLRIRLIEQTAVGCDWKGISSAMRHLFDEFAIGFEKNDFINARYSNLLMFNKKIPNKQHYLSRELLNLNLNIPYLFKELDNRSVISLFKILNLYIVFNIEFLSLCKIILEKKSPLTFIALSNNLIVYENGTYSISKFESENINKLIKIYNSKDNSLFNETVHFSLKELAVVCILNTSKVEFSDGLIKLSPLPTLNIEEFDNFLKLFLTNVSNIENEIFHFVSKINFSLSRNFDFPEISATDFNSINQKVISILYNLNRIRNKYGSKRNNKLGFVINGFGRTITVNRFFKSNLIINDTLLKGAPLTATHPSQSSKFSYDIFDSKIINVVIPNERVDLFFNILKNSMSLNRRLLNLYLTRFLVIDVIVMSVLAILLTALTFFYDKNKSSNVCWSTLWVIRQGFGIPLAFFISKVFLYDLKIKAGRSIFDFLKYKK